MLNRFLGMLMDVVPQSFMYHCYITSGVIPQHLICKISGRDLKHFKRLSCALVSSLFRQTTRGRALLLQ